MAGRLRRHGIVIAFFCFSVKSIHTTSPTYPYVKVRLEKVKKKGKKPESTSWGKSMPLISTYFKTRRLAGGFPPFFFKSSDLQLFRFISSFSSPPIMKAHFEQQPTNQRTGNPLLKDSPHKKEQCCLVGYASQWKRATFLHPHRLFKSGQP